MEYLPGGDLMTHMIRKDKFTEVLLSLLVVTMAMP